MNRWVCSGVIAPLVVVTIAMPRAGSSAAWTEGHCALVGPEPLAVPIPRGGGGVVVMPVEQKVRVRGNVIIDQIDQPGLPVRPRALRPGPQPGGASRIDQHGDPLPAGAVARYGTVRLRHGPEPHSLGFTADGKMLGTFSNTDDGLRLWDPATGKELHRLNTPVHLAAFARDGSVLITDAGRCKHWVPVGNTIRNLPENTLPENVMAIAVAPDCRYFAVGSQHKVLLIDIQTGKPLRELKCGIDQIPIRLVFSPDGRWLAGNGQSHDVWLWDLRTGKRVRTYRSEFDFPEYTFSHDGTKIAITGVHFRVYPTDSEEVGDEYKPPEGNYLNPRFSTDDKWVYAISPDGRVIQVNATTGEAKEPWPAPEGDVRLPMALAPDGAFAAAIDQSGGIKLWDPRTGKGPQTDRLPNLGGPGFSADGKTIWCLAVDGRVHGFDAATGKQTRVIDLPVDGGLPVIWDPATRRAVTLSGGDEFELQLIDVDAGKVAQKLSVPAEGGFPHVVFCPTDHSRAALFAQGTVLVVNVSTGKTVRSFTTGKPEDTPPSHGGISPDGRLVAISTPGQVLSVCEISTGKKRFEVDAVQDPENADFSPDGRFLAIWNGAGNIVVFDVRLGTVARRLQSSNPDLPQVSVAFSPDSKRLAVGEWDGLITIWEIGSGNPLVTYDRHEGFVNGLAFSPDGKRLATTSQDGTVLVWEVPQKPIETSTGLSVGGFDEAFKLLGSTDAAAAQRGMEYLYRRQVHAVKQCDDRIAVPAAVAPGRVGKLIDDLANEDFPVRQAALKALADVGGEAVPELRQAAEKSSSAEVRKLAAEALARIENSPPATGEIRSLRAVEVLENIGTPEARMVLAKWAAGPTGQRLTTEAAAALARMK